VQVAVEAEEVRRAHGAAGAHDFLRLGVRRWQARALLPVEVARRVLAQAATSLIEIATTPMPASRSAGSRNPRSRAVIECTAAGPGSGRGAPE